MKWTNVFEGLAAGAIGMIVGNIVTRAVHMREQKRRAKATLDLIGAASTALSDGLKGLIPDQNDIPETEE